MENNNVNEMASPFAAAFEPAPAPAPAPEAAPAEEKKPTYEDLFTPEEMTLINNYAEKINIADSATVLSYGTGAQKKIADFSDQALAGARVKDFGETGDMIAGLLSELRGISDVEEEKKGFLGLFKKTKNKIEQMKIRYSKAEESVDNIVTALEAHQVTLLKDISIFDSLYETNLNYLKELTMYIAAGKIKLNHERTVTLPKIREYAEKTGKPEDAQAARDFNDMCLRFERRLHDLELTRTVAIQTAPQIRLLQNNDTMMSEKIQSVIVNTIPLWKSQMVIALGIAHAADAMAAQKSVTDMTNELIKKNAASLRSATVDIARESERGIVDIETLTAANEELIATLTEVQQIQAEAGEKRRAAEAELHKIENDLKEKLLNIK